MHLAVEVILFGDEEGAGETARELGLRHEPYVERNEYGTKRLDYMFTTARALARHDILCYVNCDIILMEDFRRALERVKARHEQFLMLGRRWDAEMPEPCDFTQANWRSQLQALALMRGVQRTPEWIDYFAFNRELFGSSLPPFVVGRVHWDQWLVWKARECKKPVVDVSPMVIAVHQMVITRRVGKAFGMEWKRGKTINWREAGGICARSRTPRRYCMRVDSNPTGNATGRRQGEPRCAPNDTYRSTSCNRWRFSSSGSRDRYGDYWECEARHCGARVEMCSNEEEAREEDEDASSRYRTH